MIELLNLIRDVFAVIGFIATVVLVVLLICYDPEPTNRIKRGRGPLG